MNNSVTNWIREGNIYKHNGGGVEIELQTYTGDNIINKTIWSKKCKKGDSH